MKDQRSQAQWIVARILIVTSLLIWGFVFWQSRADFHDYPRSDLRNRVVGARRLMDGIDPYTESTKPLPEFYRAFSPTTVSPAHLLLYIPLRTVYYNTQRKIYFGIDWAITLVCLLAIGKFISEDLPRSILLFLFSTLLLLDLGFRLHLARGQSYLLLALLAAVVAIGLKDSGWVWISSSALAVLLLLRPTCAITVVALLLFGHRRFVLRMAAVFLVLAALTLSLTGTQVWKSYFQMIRQAEDDHLTFAAGGIPKIKSDHLSVLTQETGGADYTKWLSVHGYEHDRTFLGLFSLELFAKDTAHRHVSGYVFHVVNSALLWLTALAGLYFAFRLRSNSDIAIKVALAFLLPIDIESFGPQRYAYSDVLFSLPLIWITSTVVSRLWREHGLGNWRTILLLIGVLCFALIPHIETTIPAEDISVIRFFVALLAANIFCICSHPARKMRSNRSAELTTTT